MNTANNWKLGLTLSLITVFFWATLAVALDIGMKALDEWTLTWFRFCVAAVITLIIIGVSGSWKSFLKLNKSHWLWLLLAATMLIANYVLFILGLNKTSPGNAQVLIQLAPLLMTLGGVVIYKESFKRMQKIGVVCLLLGLGLFFQEQLGILVQAEYTQGAIIIIFAAITWAIYALIQKQLIDVLSPQAILTFIYVLASIVLLPLSYPEKLSSLSSNEWMAVGYAALNTVGAYGAFAQALKYWQASRVGMVIALTPVFTFFFINLMSKLFPNLVEAEKIHSIGWIGVALIVMGSMFASLGKD